jgi:hypothetical protein
VRHGVCSRFLAARPASTLLRVLVRCGAAGGLGAASAAAKKGE